MKLTITLAEAVTCVVTAKFCMQRIIVGNYNPAVNWD